SNPVVSERPRTTNGSLDVFYDVEDPPQNDEPSVSVSTGDIYTSPASRRSMHDLPSSSQSFIEPSPTKVSPRLTKTLSTSHLQRPKTAGHVGLHSRGSVRRRSAGASSAVPPSRQFGSPESDKVSRAPSLESDHTTRVVSPQTSPCSYSRLANASKRSLESQEGRSYSTLLDRNHPMSRSRFTVHTESISPSLLDTAMLDSRLNFTMERLERSIFQLSKNTMRAVSHLDNAPPSVALPSLSKRTAWPLPASAPITPVPPRPSSVPQSRPNTTSSSPYPTAFMKNDYALDNNASSQVIAEEPSNQIDSQTQATELDNTAGALENNGSLNDAASNVAADSKRNSRRLSAMDLPVADDFGSPLKLKELPATVGSKSSVNKNGSNQRADMDSEIRLSLNGPPTFAPATATSTFPPAVTRKSSKRHYSEISFTGVEQETQIMPIVEEPKTEFAEKVHLRQVSTSNRSEHAPSVNTTVSNVPNVPTVPSAHSFSTASPSVAQQRTHLAHLSSDLALRPIESNLPPHVVKDYATRPAAKAAAELKANAAQNKPVKEKTSLSSKLCCVLM
ncbi:Tea1 anchoring protein Mod5, partial [Schizosaccharomyces japonicus yFS275]